MVESVPALRIRKEYLLTHHRSMTWEDRCEHLAKWVESNGRTPSQMSDEAIERSCYNWLTINRKNLKAGKLTPDQEKRFRALPVSDVARNTMEDRMDELERFFADHQRLPRTTALDSKEKSLATFLTAKLRAKIKKSSLSQELLERAQAVPGVVDFSLVPDQEKTLEELSEYAARHGHLPPFGVSDNRQEYRLSTWIRNNTKGRPEDKTPALRARHEAILDLMERYPAAVENARERLILRREQLLTELENFAKEHRHLPSSTRGTDEESLRLSAALTAFRGDLEAGKLSSEDQIRVKAVLGYPSYRDHEWQTNFETLIQYAATHDGRLPGNWADGKLFSWLTSQRRQYRKGALSQQRLERLETVDGVLPK